MAEGPTPLIAPGIPDGINYTPTPEQALLKIVSDVEMLIQNSHGIRGLFTPGSTTPWETVLNGNLSAWLGDALETGRKALGALSTASAEAAPVRLEQATPAYQQLADVLQLALDQAQSGKGADRHADNKAFEDQPILNIARMLDGIGGHSYQIMKKAQEAARMVRREKHDAAVQELLGVIVYASAAVLRIREQQVDDALALF